MDLRVMAKNASVTLASTVISVLLAEVILRIVVFGTSGFSPTLMTSYGSDRFLDSLRPTTDSLVAYELRPNLDHLFRFRTLQTNDQGLRDKDYNFNKPNGTTRIAVIGDSFTMGWGVEREDIYHEIIEHQLNQFADSIRYEFINFGVASYNLTNYLGVFGSKAQNYSPDYLMIGFCSGNDYKPDRKDKGPLRTSRRNKDGFFNFYLHRLYILQKRAFQAKSSSEKVDEVSEPFIRKRFGQIMEIADRLKIPVFLVYLAIVHEDDDPARSKIKQIAQESRMIFVDASTPFKDTDPHDFVVNMLDSHPNEEGHASFARAIMESPEFKVILNQD